MATSETYDPKVQRPTAQRLPRKFLTLARLIPYPTATVQEQATDASEYDEQQGAEAAERDGYEASEASTRQASQFKVNIEGGEKGDVRSLLGTPVPYPIRLGGIELPNSPLIKVGRKKKIISTEVAGRDHPFLELINNGSFDVSITGFLVEQRSSSSGNAVMVYDRYPEELTRQIDELVDRRQSVSVECELLSWFNINRLVIKSAEWDFTNQYSDAVPFQLKCMSDEPTELEIIDEGA